MYRGGIVGIKKQKILFVTNPRSSLSRFKRECTIASSAILLLWSYSLLSYDSCSERLLFIYITNLRNVLVVALWGTLREYMYGSIVKYVVFSVRVHRNI